MTAVIATGALTRRYGAVDAVEGLSLRVGPGEIYGFLGVNGAGKSTTIRMLLGLVRPSAGWVELFGTRVRRGDGRVWSRVGHLVEAPAAYPELTATENLEVARRLREVRDRGAVARALQRLGLGPYADHRARSLSSGNLQRLGLAKALLHEPDLLVLDEPANALDPAGVVEVRELLRELAHQRGVTVFMSSHILGEVARLATRIGIIHRGRLLEQLDAAELERRQARRVVVETRDQPAAGRVPTYLGVLAQATAVGGVLLFGLATIWVFGREYSHRTATDLLALPTGPAAIVAAKFLVVAVWSAGLVAIVFLLGLAVGSLIGLPVWSVGLALRAAGTVAATGGLTLLLVTALALAASAGSGYLPAVGVMFLMVFLAQVVAAAGWGAYFPWSVPALYSGIAGRDLQQLGTISYLLVATAGLAGVLGTFAWWRLADQT